MLIAHWAWDKVQVVGLDGYFQRLALRKRQAVLDMAGEQDLKAQRPLKGKVPVEPLAR